MKHKFKQILLATSLALVASVAFAGTITQTVNNPDGSKTVTVYTTDENGKVDLPPKNRINLNPRDLAN